MNTPNMLPGSPTYHGIAATLLMRSIQNFHPMNPEAD
jgi:hypothetical protein